MIVVTTSARYADRGTVRAGFLTSPLGINATSIPTNAYKPPVNDTRLPAIAKQVTNKTIAIAQQRNANGAAEPSPFATVAGITKIPAPIVELTIFAVRAGTPMPRTN